MVYLEFVSNENGLVIYDYMPESKDASRGTLSVDSKTGRRAVIKKSPECDSLSYCGHAWKRIEEMIADGNLKETTYAAWY